MSLQADAETRSFLGSSQGIAEVLSSECHLSFITIIAPILPRAAAFIDPLQHSVSEALGRLSNKSIQDALLAEVRSPWTRYDNRRSTHVTPALRLEPTVVTGSAEGYRGDLFLIWTPWLLAGIGILYQYISIGEWSTVDVLLYGLCGWSCGSFLRLALTYSSTPKQTGLIAEVMNLSKYRGRGTYVQLSGKLVDGPSIGLPTSVALKDESGSTALDAYPTTAFLRRVSAISVLSKYIGDSVTIEGWYRRNPWPTIQVRVLRKDDRRAQSSTVEIAWIVIVITYLITFSIILAGL